MSRTTTRALAIAVALLVWGVTAWVRRSGERSAPVPASPAPSRPLPGPAPTPAPESDARLALRNLEDDEAAGGHTLRKHVGRSDEQLAERLRKDRRISAASTWTDREIAERVIGAALVANRDRIDRWLAGGARGRLVLDAEEDAPVGRTLRRGDRSARDCSAATIVLAPRGDSFYVLTAYPEEER